MTWFNSLATWKQVVIVGLLLLAIVPLIYNLGYNLGSFLA